MDLAAGGATVRQTPGADPAGRWLPFYERRLGQLSYRQRQLVRHISAATLDRLLASAKAGATSGPGTVRHQTGEPAALGNSHSHGHLGFNPSRVSGGRQRGPLRRKPGRGFHLEPDLHGYFERLDRGRRGVEQGRGGRAGGHAESRWARLPFLLLGFDSDNGGEFLNHHLWTCLRERKNPVEFTRSRPYHSDDNAHVEQKNWTWARQLFGCGRFEDPELVAPMSALYRDVRAPLRNFFLPCLKLKRKWRERSKWRRRHELPKTAYERLCAPGILPLRERRQLRERHASLDPFVLKDDLEEKLKRILKPGQN